MNQNANINTTVKVLDDSEQKAEFEKYLAPVVMFDPVAFESIDKASEKMLLESSLWATLMNMDSNKYNYDDMQMLVVNQTDVDAACAKLFGKDVRLDHRPGRQQAGPGAQQVHGIRAQAGRKGILYYGYPQI